MGVLNKIRTADSRLGINSLSIIAGLIFMLYGIVVLFHEPFRFFNEQTLIYGDYGPVPIPLILFSLFGWTLFAYGILNKLNWTNFKSQNRILNKFPLRKRIGYKNTIFIISSVVFISFISSTFLIIRPDEKIRERNEKFNKQIEEINQSWERINQENEKKKQ